VDNLSEFEGGSVHYWATPIESRLCSGQEVALVGAGNSAGQAVVYLSPLVKKLWLLARGASLEASMSNYLVERIRGLPNVEVLTRTAVSRLEGADGMLSAVTWRNGDTGAETRRPVEHLFSLIGADPNTSWLASCNILVDRKGFVLTGGNGRHPLATSLEGVFAIGDVRADSIKRVASAVGEGAQVVAALHDLLAHMRASAAPSMIA
jgi:thioredoxin reductase (NADPH)